MVKNHMVFTFTSLQRTLSNYLIKNRCSIKLFFLHVEILQTQLPVFQIKSHILFECSLFYLFTSIFLLIRRYFNVSSLASFPLFMAVPPKFQMLHFEGFPFIAYFKDFQLILNEIQPSFRALISQ